MGPAGRGGQQPLPERRRPADAATDGMVACARVECADRYAKAVNARAGSGWLAQLLHRLSGRGAFG